MAATMIENRDSQSKSVFPAVTRVIDEAVSELDAKVEKLKGDCVKLKTFLKSLPQTRAGNRPESCHSPQGKTGSTSDCVLMDSPRPHSSNSLSSTDYSYRVRCDNKVYCFRTLDDLLSRVVTYEDLEKPEETGSSSSEFNVPENVQLKANNLPEMLAKADNIFEHYLTLRKKQKRSVQERKCIQKLNKLLHDDYENLKLFYGDVADKLDAFLKRNQSSRKEKRHSFNTLIEQCCGTNQTSKNEQVKLTKEFDKIQYAIQKALARDLEMKNYPEDIITEVYKVGCALRNIDTLRLPVLVQQD